MMLINGYKCKLEFSCFNKSPTSVEPVNREVSTVQGCWPIQCSGHPRGV